ncbi:hypothetical protein BDZ89DRAFT_1168881 [Hymenopellis radicata]|nr:hypothetical protein BDZ89DRAFT_1168881 [Hymenopellis radicata]
MAARFAVEKSLFWTLPNPVNSPRRPPSTVNPRHVIAPFLVLERRVWRPGRDPSWQLQSDSDYWSCTSCISHEDGRDLKEDGDNQLEVLEYREDDEWVSIQSTAIPNVFHNGAFLRDTGWRPIIEYLSPILSCQSSTREYVMLLRREKYHLMVEYGVPTIFAHSNHSHQWRLDRHRLFKYARRKDSLRLCTGPTVEGSCASHANGSTRFREMNVRRETLSKICKVGHASYSSSVIGQTNMTNIVTCLDVAESVSKLIPVVGNVLEGACGVLRKIVQAAEGARAAREVCKAIAEHTACITLAIVNEIGPAPAGNSAEVKRICDLSATIDEVERKITALSSLGKMQYFVSRGKINTEVMVLRQKVDNARVAFQIRNDISMTRMLTDLKNMHTCLMARVDDLVEELNILPGLPASVGRAPFGSSI